MANELIISQMLRIKSHYNLAFDSLEQLLTPLPFFWHSEIWPLSDSELWLGWQYNLSSNKEQVWK